MEIVSWFSFYDNFKFLFLFSCKRSKQFFGANHALGSLNAKSLSSKVTSSPISYILHLPVKLSTQYNCSEKLITTMCIVLIMTFIYYSFGFLSELTNWFF